MVDSAVDDVGLIKKRKYSEDGEGLSDTAVVVVPGMPNSLALL